MRMERISLLILVALFAARLSAANPLLENLQDNGFQCAVWHERAGRPNGWLCTAASVRAAGFSYPAPVGVVIPDGVEKADSVILHFHGFQNVCRSETIRHPAGIIEDFALLEPVAEGPGVLVVPLSYGKIDTFKGHWLPRKAAARAWLEKVLMARNARWILSGHSAGGYVINHFMDGEFARSVDRIVLLDATYWRDAATIARWKSFHAANPDLRFFSVYRPGSGTEQGSRLLKNALPAASIELISTRDSHCLVPNRFFRLVRE